MKNINIYLKSIIIFCIYILITSIITSFIYLNTKITYKTNSVILYILTILIFIILSYKNSKKGRDKGYISGLKTSLSLIGIMLILSFFFKDFISIKKVIYYIILILISIGSSIIGINTKKG